MVKHLSIEVNGIKWVDGDFDEITISDGPNGVKVEGRNGRAPTGGGLLDLLANAGKARNGETKAALQEPQPNEP